MGIKTQTGFTVIETMLFLAVTGMLGAAILVGSGVAIGQQRYRDSVNSLKSYIQQQYNEVTSVANGRDKSWLCNDLSNVTQTTPSGGEARGTSDCMLLGRYVTIDATGTKLAASNVIGSRDANATDAPSDIEELTTNYTLGISPIDTETEEVQWSAQVVKQETTTPMPLTMLIIRSPLSGSILTFTADGVQTNLAGLISTGNMQQKNLCVNAEVGSFVGKRMAVQVGAFATNQSAIQIPPESSSVCG